VIQRRYSFHAFLQVCYHQENKFPILPK
jgi:hypothetical protein